MKLRRVICILLIFAFVLCLTPWAAAATGEDGLKQTIIDACIYRQEADLSAYGITYTELEKTFDALYDQGLLPWYTTDDYGYSYSELTHVVKTFTPETLYGGKLDMAAYEEKAAQILAACVFPGMAQWQIALSIHDYLIANTAYDETLEKNSAYDILVSGTAVCVGYAQVYQDLLTRAGIACTVVVSEPMKHAWNLVCIDNNWYHVDMTWDDPTPDKPGYVSHQFFLLTDEEIAAGEEPHYDWKTDITCGDTRFSQGFWRGVESQICYESSDICYLLRTDDWTNYIYRRSESAGTEEQLYKESANSINIGHGKYMYQHLGLSLRDGRLWFNTLSQLMSMNPNGTDQRIEYTNTGNTYVYSSHVSGNTATLRLVTHAGDQSTRSLTLEPPQAHTHSFTRTVHDAGCTENGHTQSVCDCGLEAQSTPVKATGHAYIKTAEQEATLFGEGFATYACDNCGDSYTESFPKEKLVDYVTAHLSPIVSIGAAAFWLIFSLLRIRKRQKSRV